MPGASPDISLWLSTNAPNGSSVEPLSKRRRAVGESVWGTPTLGEELPVGVKG